MNGKVNGSGARTCDTMMRDALLHALQQEIAVDGCIMSKMQAIAGVLVAKALAGDMRAIKEVFDRIDGKARPAMVAREQPTEAQAGIGLKEQLRRLTAWDFPPPAAVAPEQPMEAQADIGLKEQLRQLTAWDFPPPAAAGSDEQCTPSVDMPPPCETGNGIASPLPIGEPSASPVSSPNVARKLPPVSPSDLARASRLAVDILAERSQRENPQAIPNAHREIAAQSEAARNCRGDAMALTGFAARADAPPSPLWRAKTLEGPDPRCFA